MSLKLCVSHFTCNVIFQSGSGYSVSKNVDFIHWELIVS